MAEGRFHGEQVASGFARDSQTGFVPSSSHALGPLLKLGAIAWLSKGISKDPSKGHSETSRATTETVR